MSTLFDTNDYGTDEPKSARPAPAQYYVDYTNQLYGFKPHKSLIGRMGTVAKNVAKDESITENVLYRAIEIVVEKEMDPGSLYLATFQAQTEKKKESARKENKIFNDFLKENGGWPTGARFARGTHSGHYVYDPLGYDRPPADFPFTKPRREDIIEALRNRWRSS